MVKKRLRNSKIVQIPWNSNFIFFEGKISFSFKVAFSNQPKKEDKIQMQQSLRSDLLWQFYQNVIKWELAETDDGNQKKKWKEKAICIKYNIYGLIFQNSLFSITFL
jgi:hypothetical protein